MRRLMIVVLAAAAWPAWAQVVSEAPERAAVTIYRAGEIEPYDPEEDPGENREEGLAFISESRTVELPAGRSRISFRGVAETMVPETAAVEGLPGLQVERNEDFDLLSAGSLLEASIGKTVRLVSTNPKTGAVTQRTAVVRAGPDQPVLEVDGRLEGLRCSGAPERLVFDQVPEGLTDRPTFSVLADVPKPGRYTVRLSYLATGFNWSADYVAKIAPDGRSLDLIGWLTLANHTAASFAQAPTDVVAGELERTDETVPPEVEAKEVTVSCWPIRRPVAAPPAERRTLYRMAAGAPASADVVEEVVVTAAMARQSELGDYKLYTLPEPTTVAARQTKQVLFLDQRSVPVERVYAYRVDDDTDFDDDEPDPPTVLLRLKNEAAAGLGKPLPSGVVSVMEPGPNGAPVLAGEHRVKDTPVGLPLEIELGRAMDVSVRVSTLEDKEDHGRQTARLEVTVVNDKPQAIAFEYRQARLGEDFKVSRASRKPGEKNGEPMWTLRLKPGERATFAYTVSFRDD